MGKPKWSPQEEEPLHTRSRCLQARQTTQRAPRQCQRRRYAVPCHYRKERQYNEAGSVESHDDIAITHRCRNDELRAGNEARDRRRRRSQHQKIHREGGSACTLDFDDLFLVAEKRPADDAQKSHETERGGNHDCPRAVVPVLICVPRSALSFPIAEA